MENSFAYTYSPKENQEALDIRSKYLPREETKLEQLKRLDREVHRTPAVFAYIFGSLAAIIMGSGMSLTMTDLGDMLHIPYATVVGIVIGVAGMALAALTYPVYKGMVNRRARKYAPKIIALSDEIVKG